MFICYLGDQRFPLFSLSWPLLVSQLPKIGGDSSQFMHSNSFWTLVLVFHKSFPLRLYQQHTLNEQGCEQTFKSHMLLQGFAFAKHLWRFGGVDIVRWKTNWKSIGFRHYCKTPKKLQLEKKCPIWTQCHSN